MGDVLDRAGATLDEPAELVGADVRLEQECFFDPPFDALAVCESQVEPLWEHRLHDGRSAGLPLHIFVENCWDAAGARLGRASVERLLPPPLLCISVALIEYCRGREDHAPLCMHTRAAGAAHKVVKVANKDLLAPLSGRGHDQVLEQEVDALRQRRCADHELGEAFRHRMLDRQPQAVWRIGMMSEDAESGGARCAGSGSEMRFGEATDLLDFCRL
jgi:hypothetical protein